MVAFRDVAVAAVALSLVTVAPATAQNYDGNHQVRFGVFGHFAPMRGTASDGVVQDDYSIFTSGIGASAGLEWIRRPDWAWGVEMDVSALRGNEADTAGNKLSPNYLATLRLRGGRYLRPDLFWYGTLGVGVLGAETKFPAALLGTKISETRAGFVIGTGFEWEIRGALLFAEYLYGDFGTFSATNALATHTCDADMHIFRLGLKFKVGHDHYDDDVARRIGRVSK